MVQKTGTESNIMHASGFINAFQLIAMSHDLDLSRLFEEQVSSNAFMQWITMTEL